MDQILTLPKEELDWLLSLEGVCISMLKNTPKDNIIKDMIDRETFKRGYLNLSILLDEIWDN